MAPSAFSPQYLYIRYNAEPNKALRPRETPNLLSILLRWL